MISVRVGTGGMDALRAYDPTRQFYSGLNGVLALLGHCVVELVYERVFEPEQIDVAVNRRYDRVRAPNGRFVMVPRTMTVKKTAYRDMSQRSVVPVDPSWRGAPKRRMLVTRDFAMLNDWGAPVFGFRPPSKATRHPNNVLVVWDCLWQDWRRISLEEPIAVSAVIPTTMFPGVGANGKYNREAVRLVEIQKQVLFRIFEANFHGKKKILLNYMDNRINLNLQFQEESLRKQYFDQYEQHQRELEERRRKDAERRERQRLEKERLAQQEEQRKAEQEAKAQQQAQQQQQQAQQRMQQQQAQKTTEQSANPQTVDQQEARQQATSKTNLEKKGPVEIQDGSATKAKESTQKANGSQGAGSNPAAMNEADENAIPDGVIGQNGERKDKKRV